MATTKLSGTPVRADHCTAPLPPAAAAALRSLEFRLTVDPAIVRAVTRYEAASLRATELAKVAASGRMSDMDADSLAAAEDLMAASLATLAEAGALYLVAS